MGVEHSVSNRRETDKVFLLREGVYLVRGASRAAVYDTNRGLVYSLNDKGAEVLLFGGDEKFISDVRPLGILPEESKKVSILEKSEDSENLETGFVSFLWLEITGKCNLKCAHCYGSFGQNSFLEKSDLLSYEEWVDVIDQAYIGGTRRVQLIGGEPAIFRSRGKGFLDLANYAIGRGFEFVEVFTNGTLITEPQVKEAKELGLHFALSLYSVDSEVHDKVTGCLGSYKKTMETIKLLQEYGVPFRIAIIGMSINEETLEETLRVVSSWGIGRVSPDVVRPMGSGRDNYLLPSVDAIVKYSLRMEPDFSVDKEGFIRNMNLNPCLAGKLAVTANGDVIPCIFARNIVLGNVRETELSDIVFSEDTQKIWRQTLDDVLVCKDCEYRYACYDCRPLAMTSGDKDEARWDFPQPRCTYNPYTGEWGKGVWKFVDGQVQYFPIDRFVEIFRKGVKNDERGV